MAQKDAPNYCLAENPNQKCANCCALQGKTWCSMFNFHIELGMTCDDWCPSNKAVAKILRSTARILDSESEK